MSSSLKQKLDVTVRGYALLSAALFFVTGIVYLVLGRWPVTHQDFWRIYDTCLHRSWLYSTALKYNGHSHFFPAQLWLADLRWLSGNQDFLFAAGLLFQLIATAVLVAVIWRDISIERTTRLVATMVVIVCAFWMGRASMTATGGFNCCYSLVLSCAALSFYFLSSVARGARGEASFLAVIIICNTVATFSFGTGLTTWPASLFVAYCLRLRARFLFVLALAAIVVALIFVALPAREAGSPLAAGIQWAAPGTYLTLLHYFCRLLGSPALHVCAAWIPGNTPPRDQLALLAMSSGVGGVIFASVVFVVKLTRRNLSAGLETIALGLITLNFTAFALITLARADHISVLPEELDAPRYLYWSSLFWVGLLLFALAHAQKSTWLRWPALGAALAAPVLAFPSHYREGLHWHYARLISYQAGVSLINGIHDDKTIGILSPYPGLVYRLAKDMRARRLDMFAAGYQEWIGRPVSALFPAPPRSVRLRGNCIARVVQTQPLGVRITGSIAQRGGRPPDLMLIIDSRNIIRGIAFSSATRQWINELFYANTFGPKSIVGFVAHYDPSAQYAIRSVEKGTLSSESVPVPPASLTKSE